MAKPDQCPLCAASARQIETLAGDRCYFCNCCGRWFGLNEQGRAVISGPTQHERPAKTARLP